MEKVKPPKGLFEKVFLAIQKEAQKREGRKILTVLFLLLIVSGFTTPFLGIIFVNQIKNSGIIYFISSALGDLGLFFVFWKEYLLAILESFPVFEMSIFLFGLALFCFALRLFLHKKNLLLRYLLKQYCIVV